MTFAIEARDVEKRYSALQALAGVSLAVAEGEFFGLSDFPPLASLAVVGVSFIALCAACLLLLRSGYKLRQ